MSDSALSTGPSRSRPGWIWLLAGLVLIVAGFLAMVHPFATSLTTALVLGCAMIAGGAFAVAAGLAHRDDRWLYWLPGLAAVAIGVVVLLYPLIAAVGLVWAIGGWLIAGGILQLVAGVRGERRTGLILLGFMDVVLGVLLIVMDPISAMFFLAVAVGFTFVLHGAAMLVLALRLRRAPVAD